MEFILKIHNYENATTLQRYNATTRKALIITFVLMVSSININIQAQNTFPNSGNVGINTTTPSSSLDVNGNMKIDSSLTVKDSVRVQKRLVVDQDVKIKGNSVFTGDGKFKNELKVLGIGKFKDQLKVFGKANFKNKLVVDSTAKFKDKLVVDGLTKMNGDAKVFGDLKIKSLADPSFAGKRMLSINPAGKIGIAPFPPLPTKCSTALPWMYADGTTSDDDVALCPDFKSVTIGGSFNVNGLSHLSTTGIGTLPNTDNMLTLRAANKIANISLLTVLPFAPTTPRYSIQNKVNQDDIIAYSVTNSNTGTDNFVVMGDGRVGIGTDKVFDDFTPGEKFLLTVDGAMRVRAINVDPDAVVWSDYVFEKNYKLRSIKSLENYIKENKHLPDVPSEKEVKEKGINLAEMDAILLQKIEELTLYIIEQQKKIEALEKQVK